MVENAFAISRKLFDNPIWYHETFTRGQAWVDIIGNANYKENEFMVRGNLVKIKRGQLGWSELTMAKRWKWSRNKVRRFLSMLEMKQQIKQQKTNITTIITILNYENYQFQINGTIQQNDTAERQQKDKKKTAYDIQHNKENKDNKDNKDNNTSSELKTYSDESTEIKLSKYLYDKILINNPKVKKPNFQLWAKHIDLMIRIDKRDPKDIKDVIDWCQSDSFWIPNILSTGKLREKFDTLYSKMIITKKSKVINKNWRKT